MTEVNWSNPIRIITSSGHSIQAKVMEEYANGMARVKVEGDYRFSSAELIFDKQGYWVSSCASPNSRLYAATRVSDLPEYVWVAFDPLRVANSECRNPEYTKVDVNHLKAFIKGENP